METSMQAESKSGRSDNGRRKWSLEEREVIVRASLNKGTTVNAVARLYGVNPSQIYDWRKQARQTMQQTRTAALVPVQVSDEVEDGSIEAKQGCNVVIEAKSARIAITGLIDASIVRTILECLRG
jgi:transposase